MRFFKKLFGSSDRLYKVFTDKKYYTESELISMVHKDCIAGITIHKIVNDIYNNLLTSDEQIIIKEYYTNVDSKEENYITYNYLDYVPFISIDGPYLAFYLHGLWQPLVAHNLYRAEAIVEHIISNYTYTEYEIAIMHHSLAKHIYDHNKSEEALNMVARHGIETFKLRNSWFKNDDCGKLDFFWPTLCNVLKMLNKYDEAIEIAQFAKDNDAYDKTKGGWAARLDKLIKAKDKYLK